jgi:hypothetical protein
VNSVKCFLHPESPERAVLNEIGITTICESAHLANASSRRIHAERRHRTAWTQYQEHLAEEREAEWRDRQERQLDATLALAKAAAGQSEEVRRGPGRPRKEE